jgi:hypothetical protein
MSVMVLEQAFQFANASLLLYQQGHDHHSEHANEYVREGINARRRWLTCEKRSDYREQRRAHSGEGHNFGRKK